MVFPLKIAWDTWRIAHSDAVTVVAQQQARLNDLVSFARANSPYYARLYHDLPTTVTNMLQLPPVTKQELMAHFDEWITDPSVTHTALESFVADPARIGHLFLGRYLVFCTSGSTGTPAVLLHDMDAWLTYNTLIYMRSPNLRLIIKNLSQFMHCGLRSAYVFATGGHFAGAALMHYRILRHPSRSRTERLFSILNPLPQLVEQLNEYQPTILNSYASVLSALAEEQQAGRLHIHPVFISSGSEILDHTIRQRIARTFSCPVFETYSASEAPAMTFECPYQQLHVNTDWHILEPIDEFHQVVPAGKSSHSLLVTNLANRVQPLIRYELGDSVTIMDAPCRCGSPFPVIHVEGRSNDILNFPTVSGAMVSVMPLSLIAIVEEISGVYSFQIIQTRPTHLKVRLQARVPGHEPQVWPEVQKSLYSFLLAQGITNVTLELAAEMPMRHPINGKLRQVWTEVKPMLRENIRTQP